MNKESESESASLYLSSLHSGNQVNKHTEVQVSAVVSLDIPETPVQHYKLPSFAILFTVKVNQNEDFIHTYLQSIKATVQV